MADAPRSRTVRSERDPLPYYIWFVLDHRANRKVRRLGWEARGLLRELFDEQWLEGAIPDDINRLAEICECPVGIMAEVWPKLKEFFVPVPGLDGMYLVNLKLESVRTKADAVRASRAVAGASGGRAKATKHKSDQHLLALGGNSQHKPYSSSEQSKSVSRDAGASRVERAPPSECPRCGGKDGAHQTGCVIGRFLIPIEIPGAE